MIEEENSAQLAIKNLQKEFELEKLAPQLSTHLEDEPRGQIRSGRQQRTRDAPGKTTLATKPTKKVVKGNPSSWISP